MRFILSRSTNPGFNLAAEEYLFLRQPDETLFLYVNEPCVVIGCNQSILAETDTTFCASQGIGLFRRLSGGGAVFHDLGNLNFCFITNRIPGQSPLGKAFLKPITEVLHRLDIPVEVGVRNDLWLPGNYKVTGTASHVGKNRELHHGTLLYDTSLHMLNRCLTPNSTGRIKAAVASVPSPVRNIRDHLLENGIEALDTQAFIRHFSLQLQSYLPDLIPLDFSDAEVDEITEIADKTYLSTAWTFKK
ncbi:MAG TPA: biotin/lipoate A/B protein ligase family protein [Bacteroidales bacterium]|nr:biotin/lipoate A/B protein ligase family protein [Bacteroidales bacterium]